ncbi:MAG: putative quinol monooxygenase, partial [Bradyrhizobium sp.]
MTFFTVTYVEVGATLSDAGAAALTSYREAVGDTRLDVLQRIDRSNQFAVLGAWADQQAFEASAHDAAASALNDKLGAALAAPNDTRQHSGLSVAAAKPGEAPILVVTHVDVVPPQKDNAVTALQQLAEASRKHAGNRHFDVWQQTNRPNHFTVVEAWADRGSFDDHSMQPPT